MKRRPSLLPLLAALPLVAVGCAPEPVSGVWVFVNNAILNNTCGDMIEISSGDFTIINNNNGTFTVDPEDGTDPFNCTLDGGGDFSCPRRLQEEYKIPNFDATIITNVDAFGNFDSDTHASGQQAAEVTCTGNACNLAETYLMVSFPCQISASFTAAAK